MPGGAPAHPVYLSVGTVRWNETDKLLEVSIRIFTNDLERAIVEGGGPKLYLGTPKERPESDRRVAEYVRSKVQLRVNGTPVTLEYAGKRDALDATACFFRIRHLEAVHAIEVHNRILTELYDTQTNIVRFEIRGEKKFMRLDGKRSSGTVTFRF